MYKFFVLVNTRTKEAWATGRKAAWAINEKETIYKIASSYDDEKNKNYAQWAKKFQTIDELDYKLFSSKNFNEVKSKANNWVTENKWKLCSSKSRPTKT